MSVSAALAMVTALAKVALEHYKTKPNYEQKKEQEARMILAEYRYEMLAEHPDNRVIDAHETWLRTFAEEML